MATGAPKRKTVVGCDFRIDYVGKRDETSILSETAIAFSEVFRTCLHPENVLYYSENTVALRHLLNDPAVRGRVKLVYIDPPFATGSAFHTRSQKHAYEDVLAGSHFLEFIRERAILLRELLHPEGSFYLHLDDKMVFSVKVVLDEIFGPENFRNCIVRKKCNPKNYTRKKYGNIADYILFYTKTENYTWNRPYEQWNEERAKEYQYLEAETGRRFMKVPIHAPGTRNGETGKPWRGMMPPAGKHWQYTPRTLDEMDARGEIFWSSNGNPRRKVYLDENPGIGVQDIWLEFRDPHNQNVLITGYPTEKNPALLERIIDASSNPGDLVLDCFAGSGTTLAAASTLHRQWIGMDSSPESIRTIFRRFTKGLERMGDYVQNQTPSSRNEAAATQELDLFMEELTSYQKKPSRPDFALRCPESELPGAAEFPAFWASLTHDH